jgi:putative DNA primase/helicase
MTLDAFLQAFYPDEDEPICVRAFKAKGAPDLDGNRPQKLSTTRRELVEPNGLVGLRSLNHLRGVYFTPNAGGHTDQEITRFNAVFVENDSLTIAEQNAALDNCPVETSIRVETKRSVHGYWLLKDGCTADEWLDMQKRLIQYFDGDKAIKNPSRVMRLPFFMHLMYNDQAAGKHDCKKVVVVQFEPERRYTIRELAERFPEVHAELLTERIGIPETLNDGNRNNDLFSIAARLRRTGL